MEWLSILTHDGVHRRAQAINGQPLRFTSEGSALFHLIAEMDRLILRYDAQASIADRTERLNLLLQLQAQQYRWAMPPLTAQETELQRRQRLTAVWSMFLHLYFLQIVEARLPETALPIDPNPPA